jgi:hypothetical protein
MLPLSAPLTAIPTNTVAGAWHREARQTLPKARRRAGAGYAYFDLIDLDFCDFVVAADQKSTAFGLANGTVTDTYDFRLDKSPTIVAMAGTDGIEVEIANDEWQPLGAWLSQYPPRFFSATLDAFEGHESLGRPALAGAVISAEHVITSEWIGCETQCEFDLAHPDRKTVHRYLRDQLESDPANQIILYDHRSGELADFVVLSADSHSRTVLHLYHCKGAGGAPSGARTNDVTELVLQTVKCLALLQKDTILEHVKRRTALSNPHRSVFHRGDLALFQRLLAATEPIDLKFEIYAVQPGIDFPELEPALVEPMAAAVLYVNQVQPRCRLRWMVYAELTIPAAP